MDDRAAGSGSADPSILPAAVQRIGRRLVSAGHDVFTVGPCLRDLIAGVHPAYFELSTNATPGEITRLFSNAVLIDARQGRMTLPTSAGSTDLTPFRVGTRVEDDLAHRDFTINAMAYDEYRKVLLDPYAGRTDLVNGLVRAVRSARDRLEEDPLRALRAIRLAATRGWKLDPELESALSDSREALTRIPREPARRELTAILLSPGVALAVDQLDRSGIGARLAPNATPGSGRLLEHLPADLELRLAGWLRGAPPRRALQRLRFSSPVVQRVELLLRLHPVSARVNPANRHALLRFARHTGSLDLNALIALEEAEIEIAGGCPTESRDRLLGLREAMAELHAMEQLKGERKRLVFSGADVMNQLGWPPGPRVGRALAHLTERIAKDPSLNEPDRLCEMLREWVETGACEETEGPA